MGKQVPILRANYTFQAIRVPAGNHSIKFSFEVVISAWLCFYSDGSANLVFVLCEISMICTTPRIASCHDKRAEQLSFVSAFPIGDRNQHRYWRWILSRFALCILFFCFTLNALAATHLWIENQKELVIACPDGKAVKLRTQITPWLPNSVLIDPLLTLSAQMERLLDIYENSSRIFRNPLSWVNGRSNKSKPKRFKSCIYWMKLPKVSGFLTRLHFRKNLQSH